MIAPVLEDDHRINERTGNIQVLPTMATLLPLGPASLLLARPNAALSLAPEPPVAAADSVNIKLRLVVRFSARARKGSLCRDGAVVVVRIDCRRSARRGRGCRVEDEGGRRPRRGRRASSSDPDAEVEESSGMIVMMCC